MQILLKKVIRAQLASKFAVSCGTWRFITVLTKFCNGQTDLVYKLSFFSEINFNSIILCKRPAHYLWLPKHDSYAFLCLNTYTHARLSLPSSLDQPQKIWWIKKLLPQFFSSFLLLTPSNSNYFPRPCAPNHLQSVFFSERERTCFTP